ncbi:cbb3-type cytochrome c oxidase subunit 3 [Marinomonas piezotolerans]|uniref:Cbb3-type cytochrome c oxidase subunit 3 n=1 Tax=Marinomonas piezotolerans TaxID=2213058 RepID=A0A370UDG7_9GAMM|nr:cbb3-type cytochrome c oxidase subunit 3 [Marinomonas piezotolerans]RDL45836.1 cbb3-type cytochrome c oxidase subunit 3 [Marinomonas piezotolerans]
MDINTLRAFATPLAFIAFIAIGVWTFSKSRKKGFDEAANLPFADDDFDNQSKDSQAEDHK